VVRHNTSNFKSRLLNINNKEIKKNNAENTRSFLKMKIPEFLRGKISYEIFPLKF